MNPEDLVWVEKHKPKTIEDIIAPERYKSLFRNIVKYKTFPDGLLLTGDPGCGKTTFGRVLCEEMNLEHRVINSSKNRGIDYVREVIEPYAENGTLTGNYRVLILDEADKLTIDAQDALRAIIVDNYSTCRFILTGNYRYKFIDALIDRLDCHNFTFTKDDQKEIQRPLWNRLTSILKQENVEMLNPKAVADFMLNSLPSIRHIIKRLQSLSIQGGGKIPAVISKSQEKLSVDMLKTVLRGDYHEVVKFVYTVPAEILYKFVEDNALKLVKYEKDAGTLIIFVAHYDFTGTKVRHETANTIAFLSKIKNAKILNL